MDTAHKKVPVLQAVYRQKESSAQRPDTKSNFIKLIPHNTFEF